MEEDYFINLFCFSDYTINLSLKTLGDLKKVTNINLFLKPGKMTCINKKLRTDADLLPHNRYVDKKHRQSYKKFVVLIYIKQRRLGNNEIFVYAT
jgi:hypothetical protein